MQYEVNQSTHIRGVAIVRPLDGDATTSPTARLASAFSGGKFYERERGYRMSAISLNHFMQAARLGCVSPDGETVLWTSRSGHAVYRFGPMHPDRFLKAIGKEP